jgi:hypothetical protein
LFDGTLGYWKNEQYNIELQPNAKPYLARAYPIPKIHEQTLHTEVDRLCCLGVLLLLGSVFTLLYLDSFSPLIPVMFP